MKVWIKVLDLPELVSIFGEREFSFSFPGQTLDDLLRALLSHYGPTLSQVILDPEGGLNKAVQVFIKGHLCSRQMDRPIYLQEGEQIIFLVLVNGG
jgi:hypothetical protein